MRRGTSGLCGILALDKPSGITSHDVVDVVRRLTGERRVGHAGTLDPLASGLMLVCVGPATRLSKYLADHDKTYEARIVFGAATDTDDAEGRITEAYTGKAAGQGLEALADVDPEELLARLVGEHAQLPPAYSAIKKNGVTAYKAAREGKDLELEARTVHIYSAELLGTGFTDVDLPCGEERFCAALPYWDVELTVSKGTYIRSIARDLGQALGCGAHIGSLRRTAFVRGASRVSVDDAFALAQLVSREQHGRSWPWCDPAELLGFSTCAISDAELKDVSCGKTLARGEGFEEGELVSLLHGRRLSALYKASGNALAPEVVIPGGVEGLAAPVGVPSWGEELPELYEAPRAVVAIGVFDGMHAGHRRLLTETCDDARSRSADAVVLTFDNDPDEFFGRSERFKLADDSRRIKAIWKALGARGKVVAMPATAETFSIEPEEFLDYLGRYLNVLSVHVGEGFRFGAHARGDAALIEAWCAARSIPFFEHELVERGGEPVSSSRIRSLLADGDVEGAAELCDGTLYRLDGEVVRGRGEGADLGFATANLDFSRVGRGCVLPREGVYACWACVHDEGASADLRACLPAAVNVGRAASFKEATAEVEAHILGASGEMYGKVCTLWLVKRLRDMRVFEDKDELIETVKDNIKWVRDNLVEPDMAVM